jgi:hypothetical protein
MTPFRRFPGLFALLLLAIVAVGTASTCPGDIPDRVPNGNWGGAHMGMVMSDSGGVIEFDCAAGRIPAPIPLDSHGNFDVPGLLIHQGPGPIRIDSVYPSSAARYAGNSNGHTMSVTMSVSDGSAPTQSFSMTYGGNPRVLKCL